MSEPAGAAVERVAAALAARGADLEVRTFPESTRTAAEAAAAIGCTVAQIAKSLLFRAAESGRPVLIVASGANRVDTAKIAAALGEPIARADPDFVRAKTGFAIGGVPPLGHREPPVVFLDEDLLAEEEIWAAAGTPNAVFRLAPDQLAPLTGGQVMDVKA